MKFEILTFYRRLYLVNYLIGEKMSGTKILRENEYFPIEKNFPIFYRFFCGKVTNLKFWSGKTDEIVSRQRNFSPSKFFPDWLKFRHIFPRYKVFNKTNDVQSQALIKWTSFRKKKSTNHIFAVCMWRGMVTIHTTSLSFFSVLKKLWLVVQYWYHDILVFEKSTQPGI